MRIKSAYQIKGRDGRWQACDAEEAAHNLRFVFGGKYSKAMAKLEKGETLLLGYASIRKKRAPSIAAAEKAGLEAFGEQWLKVLSAKEYRELSRFLKDAEAVAGGFLI